MRDKGGMEQDCRRDHCGQERSQEGQETKGTGSREATVVRSGVRRDKGGMEQDCKRDHLWSGETMKEWYRIRRGHCGQERSQEGQGRNGTGSGEATVVRRGVRRDKKRKEHDQVRPLWSGVESGGTRKERNRIR